jgi:hypothetical protein
LNGLQMMLITLAKNGTTLEQRIEIAKTIRMLIDSQLKPRILRDFRTISDQLSDTVGLYAKCEADRLRSLNSSIAVEAKVPVMISGHKDCRYQEAVLFAEMLSCQSSLTEAKKKATSSCGKKTHAPPVVCAPSIGEDEEVYYERMMEAFQAGLEIVRMKKSACDNITTTVSTQEAICKSKDQAHCAKRKECGDRQDRLDRETCSLAMGMNGTCSAYQMCRQQANMAFQLANKTATEQEDNLQKQWIAIKRIECIIEALSADADVASAIIDNCIVITHSLAHLRLTYPTIPDYQPCELLAEAPGTEAYAELVYKPLPDSASAKECTALCCLQDRPKTPLPDIFTDNSKSGDLPGVASTATTAATTTPIAIAIR